MSTKPSFDLGFLIFLNYAETKDAADSLEQGLRLFERAEALGYDSGWVRVHHNARTLSAPFPFLTAAALRTRELRLGTAVIPVGYEDPLRFAEDAATTDLLSGGRIELGLSSGIPTGSISDPAERARLVGDRLAAIQSAIRGDVLGERESLSVPIAPTQKAGTDDIVPLPHGPVVPGGDLVALPRSPGLENRLWYGAGSISSVLRAARLGFDLVLSTIHGDATGPTLGHTQAEAITRYREEFAQHHPDRIPRVAIGRSILPIRDDAARAEFGGLADFYDRLVTADGRYTDDSPFTGQASPLYSGEPAAIVDALLADPALALADTVMLTPLSELTWEQKHRVFADVAELAPDLGWRRTAVSAA